MPELPEVESIARGLREHILGRRIRRVQLRQPAILRGQAASKPQKLVQQLTNQTVTDVYRRAKRLLLILDGGMGLVIQLGMTGTVRLLPRKTPQDKHTHFIWQLDDQADMRLVDPRRFGRIWVLDNLAPDADIDKEMALAGLGPLGPEPLDLTPREFQASLTAKRPIKSFLLDQTKIAGLGNIYADEALFATGIHPLTWPCDLDHQVAKKLLGNIKKVLQRSIDHGGTTLNDFFNAHGKPGEFRKMLKVYQRTSQPCRRCQTPIEKLVISGRSSHFCPQCQPHKQTK